MNTQTLPEPTTLTTIQQPEIQQPEAVTEAVTEAVEVEVSTSSIVSTLPDNYHETMRLKLSGLPTKEIAQRMSCDRTTVYRRVASVAAEFRKNLEQNPKLNIICDTLQRLETIYAAAMKEHESSTSSRVRDMALNTARRASNDMMNVYLQTGLVERVPERHYSTVLSVKPADMLSSSAEGLTREDALSFLLSKAESMTSI